MPDSLHTKKIETPNTILIVDDVEINRAVLGNIFESDYDIEEAGDGREALDLLMDHESRFCAVLLDVVMPVMDGLELLSIMKDRGMLDRIPVFLITADSSGEVIRSGYDLGVMDVILKPVVPFVVKRRVNSVIELYRARHRLSNMVEIQQYQLFEQAQKIADLSLGMVEALSTAIEIRSGESGQHVRRIRDITNLLLRETEMGSGLSDWELEQIGIGAVMHDIGKIAIPDKILNKPGRLTPEEFEIMKTHTTQGSELLDRIPQMKGDAAYTYAKDITLHHHERWDGRGYPDGLKGDEISVWSQAVSIADVYDALVSERVYKRAYSHDKAREMILAGECGAFSPKLIDCFLQVEPKFRLMYANVRQAS